MLLDDGFEFGLVAEGEEEEEEEDVDQHELQRRKERFEREQWMREQVCVCVCMNLGDLQEHQDTIQSRDIYLSDIFITWTF